MCRRSIAPTLLRYFGAHVPKDMQGQDLEATIASDRPVRDSAIFGMHGGHVNVTDGRYVYMRAPVTETNMPLYNYTLMPTHMRSRFSVEELRGSELHPPFTFTKGVPTLKVQGVGLYHRAHAFGTLLFDLQQDPRQQHPIQDKDLEQTMIELLQKNMEANEAPPEQYERLGL
ncbi:hypothetical protein HMSSN036_41370 [Paenibacillus macerans]|nr:hypothetical protein HMSSN036_41370 [Paenibacillus macerans]